ncbi:hypothetical protein BX661DRAFT_182318 [Kickxella alabastrina]|uniref:uncharacterized protein n=1 Tax=Kickxella alabastrina TaxID=61397 RepID=UPI00221E90AD|nr:uncharacterized protein BX661DRAFT_182318 [Kickxella alabastrina]KAI7827733.1 hypothetical protein BX661DRAFT_182318 [Kickxella alabastrina]
MTTIPENQMSGSAPSSNSSSSSDSAQAATVAAIAAAMGYAASDHGMVQGRAARAHMHMPQSMMFSSTATPDSAHLFANSEPSFISAPALMSSAGGEPTHINSYFALNMPDTSSRNQQQQHAFTPSLINGGSSANHSMGTASASDAQAAASMMFEAISQAAAAAQVGSINSHTPGILHQQTLQSMQPLPPLMSAGSRRNSASALEPAAVAAAMMNQKYVNDMGAAAAAAMDMPLDMQMVHMFSPFYQNSPSSKEFFHLGDVQMGEQQSQQQQQQGNNAQSRLSEGPSKERRKNNSSTDMPMVSLGSTSAAVATQMGGFSSSDITGDPSQSNLMTANNNSNDSMAMDIGLGGGGLHLVNAFNKHRHAGGTSQLPILNHQQQQQQQQNVWSQELTALGGMLPPHTISHDGGTHGLNQGYGNLQRLYTPQPTDLAQFQLFQSHSPHILSAPTSSVNLNGNGNGNNNNDDGSPRYQRQFFSLQQQQQQQQRRGNNSIMQCPIRTCSQGFSDANAMKHHLNFDHTREEAVLASGNRGGSGGGGISSSPGSPMEPGFLSTLAANNSAAAATAAAVFNQLPHSTNSSSNGNSSAIPQPFQHPMIHIGSDTSSAGAGASSAVNDRQKAPHWVDPNLWSMWIAAANGQTDSITAAAAATAMGVTPGVVGPSGFFTQMPSSASSNATSQMGAAQTTGFSHYQHPTDNELLRMFDSVTRNTTTTAAGSATTSMSRGK